MNDILEKILQGKRAKLEKIKERIPLSILRKMAGAYTRRGFQKAIENKEGVNIIAEIKQTSPSAGTISVDFDPAKTAAEYTEGGAAAISVLTEEEYFKGRLEYLKVVRENSPLPVLCKDFIVDEYQLYEAAAFGADAVLLIAAILEMGELAAFARTAEAMGLCPLVEIHDGPELEKALSAQAQVIGINNRNLKDLSVDLDTASKLIQVVPRGKTIVVESGIKNSSDIEKYAKLGVNAFLVGEILMREKDKAKAIKELKNG